MFFSERFRLTVAEVIRQLREAGLDSIPGGGGEILVDEVRERVAPKKAQTDEWLGVQEEAHRQGMKTSVTMMYGMGESDADRIEHLFRIRDLQAPHRRLHGVHLLAAPAGGHADDVARAAKTDAVTYLRTLAMARIVLRQRAEPAVVLGHDGAQGRAGGAALRRQRLRLA